MFDIQETTIQIDHTNKLVEFYTTRRSVFLALVHRNPDYQEVIELNPGYQVTYPLEQCRGAESILKHSDRSARDKFLTDAERVQLEAKSQRAIDRGMGKGKTV